MIGKWLRSTLPLLEGNNYVLMSLFSLPFSSSFWLYHPQCTHTPQYPWPFKPIGANFWWPVFPRSAYSPSHSLYVFPQAYVSSLLVSTFLKMIAEKINVLPKILNDKEQLCDSRERGHQWKAGFLSFLLLSYCCLLTWYYILAWLQC